MTFYPPSKNDSRLSRWPFLEDRERPFHPGVCRPVLKTRVQIGMTLRVRYMTNAESFNPSLPTQYSFYKRTQNCMEYPSRHWTDFYEIWYSNIFQKCAEEIQVWLKYDKNNGHFIWRPMYINDTSQSSSQNEKYFIRQKLWYDTIYLTTIG